MKTVYWVDISGYDTSIYKSETNCPQFDEHIKLADAKKEAIEHLQAVMKQYKAQIKHIRSLKAADIKKQNTV